MLVSHKFGRPTFNISRDTRILFFKKNVENAIFDGFPSFFLGCVLTSFWWISRNILGVGNPNFCQPNFSIHIMFSRSINS